MDNQQERRSRDLCWLAGAWEGEGWFVISNIRRNKKDIKQHYRVECGITNNDIAFIKETLKILKEHNIPTYISVRGRKGNQNPTVRIDIKGYKRVRRFLDTITPHLRAKKLEIAKLLYDFINSREPKHSWSRYDEYEDSLYRKVKQLNARGRDAATYTVSPESIRQELSTV